eukprot:TRINITY_DN717_c0_g1_i1.p1 TRINITY_DN717_c0_g1~~TRINITY_DN717_c0_g1_i1.p1  ORF type:complete len:783 (-),score=302.52 TRINITY_DN717_c0_g1_i1:968-3316(-)
MSTYSLQFIELIYRTNTNPVKGYNHHSRTIPELEGKQIVQIATIKNYDYLFLTSTGALLHYTQEQALNQDEYKITSILLPGEGNRVVEIVSGKNVYIILTEKNVYMMGDSTIIPFSQKVALNNLQIIKPCAIDIDNLCRGETIVKVACGNNHCAFITATGQMWTFGSGRSGELGHGNFYSRKTPAKVEFFERNNIQIETVGLGFEYSIVINKKGEAYSFGLNSCGQLGISKEKLYVEENDSIRTFVNIPEKMEISSNLFITNVACGESHTLLLTQSGEVLSCGLNNISQLGLGTSNDEFIPQKINASFFKKQQIKEIYCAGSKSAAITLSNQIFVWGSMVSYYNDKIPIEFDSFSREPNLLNSNNFTIPICFYLTEFETIICQNNNNTTNNTTNNIINQDLVSISELLKFSQYADIEIKLNDKSFLAHTIIINSICNLFFKIHSIVNNSSNSKYTNYIDLNFGFWSSIENNTIIFEKFLNVLYSNIVNITNEIEEEAFNIIANQYDIKDLKNLLNELKNTKQLNTKYPFVISLPIVNLNNLLAQSICNPEFSDITLKINSNLSTFNIPAHKSLLAFRSNYFRTIFESHFKESTQNYIELNTSPAAIIYILRWCYSNLYNQTEQNSSIHVPKDLLVPLETVFFQLLELSNQYNLQGFLNQLCSNIQVTQENIFGLYWFSKTYQINEIEEACCLFLTQFPSNSNQISEIVIKSALSDNKTENDELVIQLIEKAKIAWENANNKDTVERRLRAAQLQQIFEKEKQEAINDSNKEQFKILQKIIRK